VTFIDLWRTEGDFMDEVLASILVKYQGRKQEIIPILQDVQEAYTYLPEEMIREIAKATHVPESQVYGVATFYAQFRFTPRGKKHVQVCRGTACHVNGAAFILEKVEEQLGIKEGETREDLAYSLETVACIGACSLAPTLMINDEVQAKLNSKKVKELFPREED
jgi:NADH-quinone oxidoreductase subunit E